MNIYQNIYTTWRLILVSMISVISTSACLESREQAPAKVPSTSWFAGVKSVQNLGGSPAAIKIAWDASERNIIAYRVYALLEDPVTQITSWTLLEEVNPEQTTYVNSNLNSGLIYSYKVQAVDESGADDGNTKIMSTVAFEGIAGVTVTGKNSASITLNSSSGAFDEIRVYATPKSGGSKVLIASAKGPVANINVTNLRSGTSYRFTANAYMKYLNSEDGNTLYIEGQTHSDSFGSGHSTDNSFAYRGVLNVQAYGLAPNAPTIPTAIEDPTFATEYPTVLENPQNRLVRITWLPFIGATSATTYKVVRSTVGSTMNMATTAVCTSSTDTSCVVCKITGSQRCEDVNVAAPPKKYEYAVTLVKRDPATNEEWPEELPNQNSSDFKFVVHIPPENMVLVQRDAANYEMCQNMGRQSNPRKNQRCPYYGIGDRPLNSGPGKPALNLTPGFYDLGYNLFVDRYKLACNWTRTPGACGNPDGCIEVSWNGASTFPPDNAVGSNGDVFFRLSSWEGGNIGNCYVKKNGSWYALSQGNLLSNSDYQTAATIDPGPEGQKHRPHIHSVSQATNFSICQSYSTEYGKKRLLRRREYVVASALPLIPGEPNFINDIKTRVSLENGQIGPKAYECGFRTTAPEQPTPTSFAELLHPKNARSRLNFGGKNLNGGAQYFIGRRETIRCQSRFGIQDPYVSSSYATHFADTFVRVNGATEYPMILRGETSDFDNGAVDFNGFVMDNITGVTLEGSPTPDTFMTRSYISSNIPTVGSKYIFPLGVPIMGWFGVAPQDTWNIADIIIGTIFGGESWGQGNNHGIHFANGTQTKFSMMENSRSRWGYSFRSTTGHFETGGTCALEAE